MKLKRIIPFPLFALLLLLASCSINEEAPEAQNEADLQERRNLRQRVVVCNRGSGDISVINAKNNNLISTIAMPDNGEPMYAVHVPQACRVFVGDRANNRVVAFNHHSFQVEGFAPAGNGVFHMWASRSGCQLWINNDIDNTTSVIDPFTLASIATVPTPADLVAQGGKPHDVIVSPNGNSAFITVLGLSGTTDAVVKFNANNFNEMARASVGKDPHLSLTRFNNLVYVPAQNGNAIHVLRRSNLNSVAVVPFNGAHGAAMTRKGDFLYTTDLPGNRLGALNTATNTIVSGSLTTPFSTPHNVVVNRKGNKAFVSHSGATADQLSIYTLNPAPTFVTSLTLGTNPFGLVYYTYR